VIGWALAADADVFAHLVGGGNGQLPWTAASSSLNRTRQRDWHSGGLSQSSCNQLSKTK
jgi:hypothetical protein